MKTKTLKKNKVNVVTMGCSKNLYDSEVMMAQLKANKFEVEHESKVNDASIVIINTCGFIESAKEESINTILDFVDAKKEGLVEKVYVSGCLSERYKDQLEDEIPDVDAYFGSKELPNILRTLNVFRGNNRQRQTRQFPSENTPKNANFFTSEYIIIDR